MFYPFILSVSEECSIPLKIFYNKNTKKIQIKGIQFEWLLEADILVLLTNYIN